MTIALTLLAIGILLLLIEILVIPGTGIVGIIGIVLLCASIFFGFDVSTTFGWINTGVALFLSVFFIYKALQPKSWKSVTISESIKGGEFINKDAVVAIGDEGKTIGRLAPTGKGIIQNQELELTSIGDLIDPKTKVEVVQIEGTRILVKPKN